MTLILDSGALIAVERGDRATVMVLEVARRANRVLVVPAGVIGQVWRGGTGKQVRFARLLRADEVLVEPLTGAEARAAGIFCGAAGTVDVIDASVVLAARRRRATVVSSDRSDLELLDPKIVVVDC